ncbi:hypothetical protein Ocin01_06222 [Orchesella cincta]|uniref:F-box domain-containing protein n=1 Tax=Orchesella cincta TaxID=48709 RepID=A0A1D2N5B1_ORCCI|nr:hypothetical protein Ocin01_06222 [Orchesella cincta]
MATHIDDLPNELLTEIFIRMNPIDVEIARKVCQRWEVVAEETVGVEMYLGRRSGFLSSENRDWHPLHAMQTEGISKCCLSITSTLSLSEEEEDPQLLQTKYPVFWAPYLVKSLTLYGGISAPYFNRLVSPLRNLTELDLHISALSTLVKGQVKACGDILDCSSNHLHSCISPRKLRTLRVSMKGFEFWHLQMLRPSKMCRCIENLYDILKGHYPLLQRFELGFPFFWDKESDMTKALSQFLHKHHKSLQHLSLEFHFYWRLEDKSFEELSDEDMNAYADIYELPELSEIMNLKLFNIDITDKRFIVPSIFYWEKLMLQQESLEFLKYKSGYHCALPKCLIERNCHTLKTICMTVRANSVLPVDCEVLGKCEHLERLELDGGLRLIHQVIADSRGPHLINAEYLPQTLKTVRLCSIYIDSRAAEYISSELKALKTLHLEDIGQCDDLGMSFSTLCTICDKKQLDSFKIVTAINEISLDNAKKEWKQQTPFQSLLLILSTFYELPKMIKREEDGCYIAEISGASTFPVT